VSNLFFLSLGREGDGSVERAQMFNRNIGGFWLQWLFVRKNKNEPRKRKASSVVFKVCNVGSIEVMNNGMHLTTILLVLDGCK
jgi:hypothetical protein